MSGPADAFLPLARIALGDGHAWVGALAHLLEAAARGVGQVAVDAVELPSGPPPARLLARRGDLLLLARSAASWDAVRLAVEQRHARIPAGDDAAVAAAVQSILPPAQEHDGGRIVFDNAEQRLAVAALVDAAIGVITGGPGTGKTTSAAALLAVRKRLEPDLDPAQVVVTAPTGKAACRLAASLARAATRLALPPREQAFLRALRPTTLHAALGWSPLPPERGGPFRRNRDRPMAARIVLVDEASMADLALMESLAAATPADAALWLLGDADQLDSVEAGGVLAELVGRGSGPPAPARARALAARLGQVPAASSAPAMPGMPGQAGDLGGLAIHLRHSYRARSAPWILELAALARPGGGGSWEALHAAATRHAAAGRIVVHADHGAFRAACRHAWRAMAEASAAWTDRRPPGEAQLEDLLGGFQLLVATNAQVDQANAEGVAASGARPGGPTAHGCPLLVLANHRALDLSNGDIGVALGAGPGREATVVVFPGRVAPVPLVQLSAHRPAYAITIHKSQGSEWRRVAIDLGFGSGLLDRNLVYTAITRSSGGLDLDCSKAGPWAAALA